jgi:cytochrome c oxidase subunit IV
MSKTAPHISLKTYFTVFAALMILVVVTVWAAGLNVHYTGFHTFTAMTVAFIKTWLVVLYFMHVRYSSTLTKLFAASAFVWLLLLFSLLFADYFSRPWLPVSESWANPAGQSHVDLSAPAHMERGAETHND